MDPATGRPYPLDGKGKSGTGLLANGDNDKASVSFFDNRYEMSNCSDPRWYWLDTAWNSASGSLTNAQAPSRG